MLDMSFSPSRHRQPGRSAAVLLLLVTGCLSWISTQTPQALRVDFSAPAEVHAGDSAALRLSLHNETRSDVPVTLNGSHGWAFDPLVRRSDGALVWERLAHVILADVALSVMVHPGDSLVFEATWPLVDNGGHPVAPGTYTVIPLLMDAFGKPLVGDRYARQIRVIGP